MAMKLWGGRFESGPSEVFERFSGSLHFDGKLIFADVEGSQAFARALARQGILTPEELDQLVSAFQQIAEEARDPDYLRGAVDEDVHTFVIRKLNEKAVALSAKIHTGRSRNEQVSLDIRLYLRACCDTLLNQLAGLLSELLKLAQTYPDAVIPGYTHLRRAQAVLWPHYLLAYFEMLMRDCERVQQARARINVLPLGSGALAGSGFPFDRHAIAADLNFPEITRNSMDVSADRDFALDFLYAASLIMLHLSRLSEDWILYSSEEFDWISLGDGVTSGSSLMPQKKNPDSLELIRGKSGRVFGDLTSLFVTMKGLPMTYNRDMQEDKEPLFDAFHQTSGSLAMAKVVAESVTLKPRVPAAAAEASWVVATDLAEELARSGVPFHRAHQLVGGLVLESVKSGRKPSDWTAESLAAFAPEFKPEMVRLLNPLEGMKTRELPGGTGPAAVAAALKEAADRLDKLRRQIA
ncbi:MAG TPA: argininosuccinate lyase [Bryobacteraceae bacterium]|jgi:argininosuccinate lyase|nr:argininosuccinate lyase [Bryobacteraceae bacterium]